MSRFEFWKHAGSAGSASDVSTCRRVRSTCFRDTVAVSSGSPHQTPWFCGPLSPPAPACMAMHSTASSSSFLYFRLSVSLFFSHALSLWRHTHKYTCTHPEGINKEAAFEALSLSEQRMWPSVKRLQDSNKDTVSMPSVSCIVSMADPVGFSVWEWVWLYVRVCSISMLIFLFHVFKCVCVCKSCVCLPVSVWMCMCCTLE